MRILNRVEAGEWHIVSAAVSPLIAARGWRVTITGWRMIGDDTLTARRSLPTESRTLDIIGLPEVLSQWPDEDFDDRLMFEVGRILTRGGSTAYFPPPST